MCDDIDSGGDVSTDMSSDMNSDEGTECTDLDTGDTGRDDTSYDSMDTSGCDSGLDCDDETVEEGANDNALDSEENYKLDEIDDGLDSNKLTESAKTDGYENNINSLDNDKVVCNNPIDNGLEAIRLDSGQPRKAQCDEQKDVDDAKSEKETTEKQGLSDEQKDALRDQTGWSDNVLDNIRTLDEATVYKNAGLQQNNIDGKDALTRNDIDLYFTDKFNRSNLSRMNDGLAPYGSDRKRFELHHVGQHLDSPLAELTMSEHRQGGNDTLLHDKKMTTEAHGEDNNWDRERQNYWKQRAKTF